MGRCGKPLSARSLSRLVRVSAHQRNPNPPPPSLPPRSRHRHDLPVPPLPARPLRPGRLRRRPVRLRPRRLAALPLPPRGRLLPPLLLLRPPLLPRRLLLRLPPPALHLRRRRIRSRWRPRRRPARAHGALLRLRPLRRAPLVRPGGPRVLRLPDLRRRRREQGLLLHARAPRRGRGPPHAGRARRAGPPRRRAPRARLHQPRRGRRPPGGGAPRRGGRRGPEAVPRDARRRVPRAGCRSQGSQDEARPGPPAAQEEDPEEHRGEQGQGQAAQAQRHAAACAGVRRRSCRCGSGNIDAIAHAATIQGGETRGARFCGAERGSPHAIWDLAIVRLEGHCDMLLPIPLLINCVFVQLNNLRRN